VLQPKEVIVLAPSIRGFSISGKGKYGSETIIFLAIHDFFLSSSWFAIAFTGIYIPVRADSTSSTLQFSHKDLAYLATQISEVWQSPNENFLKLPPPQSITEIKDPVLVVLRKNGVSQASAWSHKQTWHHSISSAMRLALGRLTEKRRKEITSVELCLTDSYKEAISFEMNDWLLQMQQWEGLAYEDMKGRFFNPNKPFGPPHASSTAVYLEGLIDAYTLAKEVGDQRSSYGVPNCYRSGSKKFDAASIH